MSLVFEALKKGHTSSAPAAQAQPQPQPLSVSAPIVEPAPVTSSVAVDVTAEVPAPAASVPSAVPAAMSALPAAHSGLSGQVLALVAGMALAGAGAWLYGAGKASNNGPTSAPVAQVVATPIAPPLPTQALAPVPVPVAVAAPATVVSPVAVVPPASNVVHKPVPEANAALVVQEQRPLVVVPTKLAAPPTPIAAPAVVPAAAASPASAPIVAVATPEVKPPVRTLNTQVVVTIEPTPFDVREVFHTFVQLLQTGQLAEAQSVADKITKALGRNHVMSLRAQGYVALKTNDLSQARVHYLQLHQLLPEDREAGLNLALIEWRQGDKEAAGKRVARLLEKYPGDAELQALHLNVRTP